MAARFARRRTKRALSASLPAAVLALAILGLFGTGATPAATSATLNEPTTPILDNFGRGLEDPLFTQTTLPASNGYQETRTYDNSGRLSELLNTKGASTLSRSTLTLDKVGNPIRVDKVGTNNVETYKYDSNDRISEACFKAACTKNNDPYVRFSYDAVGNRLTETRPVNQQTSSTYNALDQLTQRGSTAYAYDENGNETQAGTRSFAWNTPSQFVSSSQSGTTITYAYDGEGKRLSAK